MNEPPRGVTVSRGGRPESHHSVSGVVVARNGTVVDEFGDINHRTYPRSALKPVQAIPLLRSGAADRFGLTEAELTLACASHNGEPEHVDVVSAWLHRVGLSASDLGCGPHPPLDAAASAELTRTGRSPTALHNNCSGKHAGMLTVALHTGADTADYLDVDHGVQLDIGDEVRRLCALDQLPEAGRDGCGSPIWTMPLIALARGFANLTADESGLRLITSMQQHPFLVAGTDRPCTRLMSTVDDLVAKNGAEGVYAAAIPTQGLGLALKVADGASRAASVALVAMLDRLGIIEPGDHLDDLRRPLLRNTNDDIVGAITADAPWQA